MSAQTASSVDPSALPVHLRKFDVVDGCWVWKGGITGNGYGRAALGSRGKFMPAHRATYEALVGPIPEGLQIDHLCRNRACVNPEHLEPVTLQENVRRGEAGINNRIKTHCPSGHPYDEANTLYSRKGRDCRTCRRARDRAAYRRKGADS